jgi:hypothetical protein
VADDIYRLFLYRDGSEKEEGPSFGTLDEAVSAARKSQSRCDILLPDGSWYGREQTVGIDLNRDLDPETKAKLEQNANEVVSWMKSRPSRNKP